MDHRTIGLIISGCIIFIAVILIVVKYFLRHKENKISKKIKDDATKIQNLDCKVIDANKKEK